MRQSMVLAVPSLSLALLSCAGGGGSDGGGGAPAEHQVRLVPLPRCSDVAAAVRNKALRDMNARLDRNLAQALAGGRICARWAPSAAAPAAPTSSPNPAGSGGASSVSGTNNQVRGVDEADFVKNDGKYIYIAQGNSLRIVEAWPAPAARTIARVEVPGEAHRLYVTETRALVYSSLKLGSSSARAPGAPRPGGGDCTYGYDCELTGDGRPTQITIFDITDRTRPVVLRELVTSSSYVSARRIGDSVFTVLASRVNAFPDVADWPDDVGCESGGNGIRAAFARLREKNTRIIAQTDVTPFLPSVRDVVRRADGSAETRANALLGCPNYFFESVGPGDAFTTMLALDLGKDDRLESTTVLSRPGAVYASARALYFSVPQQQAEGHDWYAGYAPVKQLSTVHLFALDTGANLGLGYAGSGLVKGRVLNQFAMDEHDGHLRIATTTGRVPDSNVHSTMSILAPRAGGLELVGQVDQLAPREDIRSVRFDSDRGYVVTFKKTDPLFVFDLSNPQAPRVEAELKIPGFSTYMHRMDANHLLTIGYDADDQGNFAYFTGVLLQIFDVTSAQNPILAHKVVIGTRGSSSEALTNHLAFTYFPPKDLLLLPMTVCASASGSDIWGAQPVFSGLLAYNATAASGFADAGRVPHPTGAGVHCGNWWTNASSQVRRSIVMDDYVFSISGSQIKVNRLGALASDVATVSLAN